MCDRFVRHEGDGGAMMRDIKGGTLEQGVAGLLVVYLYSDTASAKAEPEG